MRGTYLLYTGISISIGTSGIERVRRNSAIGIVVDTNSSLKERARAAMRPFGPKIAVSPEPEKATRWPFVIVALLLVVALAGQLVFRFRSEIAITLPKLRPALEVLCRTLDAQIPLPRHVELMSIETSDLQTDPARGNLLVLNATLRNRARFGQAYPSLELTLTDTQDAAIARRIFAPAEYLPAKTAAGQPFAANSDVAVKLWIEAREISAAGYRLYVFYP